MRNDCVEQTCDTRVTVRVAFVTSTNDAMAGLMPYSATVTNTTTTVAREGGNDNTSDTQTIKAPPSHCLHCR